MQTTINWHNIRSISNSQNEGFEEMVCQLASCEEISDAQHFRRIGKPDGGKECYWQLNDGRLLMWQAKFFTSSFTTVQWSQIDKSVKTAIDHHKDLSSYYICIPLDLPDTKAKGTISLLQKYKNKVKEWRKYASDKGMNVEFYYWGSSELIQRLSLHENEGMLYFWFNTEEFQDSWFDQKNHEAIQALGARYSKELNVELEITRLFSGISQSPFIEQEARKLYKNVLSNCKRLKIHLIKDFLIPYESQVIDLFSKIRPIFNMMNFSKGSKIDHELLQSHLSETIRLMRQISIKLYELRDKEKEKVKNSSNQFSTEIDIVHDIYRSAEELKEFFQSDIIYLANNPYLLLTGEAGIGKSHLLADAVNNRDKSGDISLLLLGENFTSKEEPWTQILYNQLRKPALDEFKFLGALNAKAQARGSRIVLFIDAINEGEGRMIWPKKLLTFIETIKSYEWIGLVLSLRNTYEDHIAPYKIIDEKVILRKEHFGFANDEYIATKIFFQHYELVLPSSPVLNPEFHNPLFLKLLCSSLKAKGLHEIPEGHDGITAIINFYLDAVNYKLAQIDCLHYDERKKLVHKAVENTVKTMVEKQQDYILYEEADTIIDHVFLTQCHNSEPFLKRLLSEGIFNIDLRWDDKGNNFEVVYFGYQRFQDHLYVAEIIKNCLDRKNPELSFSQGRLFELTKDEKACRYNRNLLEALLIQVPEVADKELFEIVPRVKEYNSVKQSWIKSLLWRKPDSIGSAAGQFVNEVILRNSSLFKMFLSTVISASMKTNFYFNADSLHKFLFRQKLPQRDQFWSVWLQDKYGPDHITNAISRFIDWACQDEPKDYLHRDSLLLAATSISWFFTSPNRYLRDGATKALVCLYQNKIEAIPTLLERFSGVNDPYVTERLFASAYGAVLRSENLEGLAELSTYVYKHFFGKRFIDSHVLTRDYARGIIEYALYNGIITGIKTEKIRPPYKSRPLPERFPINEEIDKKYKPASGKGSYNREEWGSTAILNSMTTEYGRGTARYGDFGRYVFESAVDYFGIDADGLSNYGIQKIFEMGYDPKKFSNFDSSQGSGREAGHLERIGKKYQWIVFYELLGQVSDQCVKPDPAERRKKEIFSGPWSPYVRDIDPTMILKSTRVLRYSQSPAYWWFKEHKVKYEMPNKEWLDDVSDLPDVNQLVMVSDPQGGQWLWLNCELAYKEPEDEEESKAVKSLTYWIDSFIIKKRNKKKLISGLPLVRERGLPEVESRYEVFSREYYWSPAYDYFKKPYYNGEKWKTLYTSEGASLGKIHRTAEYFLWEEEFDCSKEDTIAYYKPTDLLFNGMGLSVGKGEGEFNDADGNLVCFDPSVNNKTFRGLLVKVEAIDKWLTDNNLCLIWKVGAEKLVFGGYGGRSKDSGRIVYRGFYNWDKKAIIGSLIKKDKESKGL